MGILLAFFARCPSTSLPSNATAPNWASIDSSTPAKDWPNLFWFSYYMGSQFFLTILNLPSFLRKTHENKKILRDFSPEMLFCSLTRFCSGLGSASSQSFKGSFVTQHIGTLEKFIRRNGMRNSCTISSENRSFY